MAFTDYTADGAVFPQDGASSGIDNLEADYNNAAYLGLLARSPGADVAPDGFSITPDFTDDTITVGDGVAYIRDSENIDFRKHFDSNTQRSGTLDRGYLAFVFQSSPVTANLETTTGVNFVYVGFRRSGQDSNFIRVADTEQTGDRLLEIARVDPTSTSKRLINRQDGYEWQFINQHQTDGFVTEADIPVSQNGFDEYKVVFDAVTGDSTSNGVTLRSRFNNLTTNVFFYRTTQNNLSGANHIKLLQGRPNQIDIGGELHIDASGDAPGFDNRLTGNEEKNISFQGNSRETDHIPLTSVQVFWTSGKITGNWNVYGRNKRDGF